MLIGNAAVERQQFQLKPTMNTQAISSVSGASALDRRQLLRSRVPHRVARTQLVPAAQAWKKVPALGLLLITSTA